MKSLSIRDRIPTRFDDIETWRRFRESLTELSGDENDVQFAISYTDHMIARLEKEKGRRDRL